MRLTKSARSVRENVSERTEGVRRNQRTRKFRRICRYKSIQREKTDKAFSNQSGSKI